MSKATDQQWRVQVRKSRAHKWVNKGLWEVRRMARDSAWAYRTGQISDPYGFGNTRVIPYVKAKKGQGK